MPCEIGNAVSRVPRLDSFEVSKASTFVCIRWLLSLCLLSTFCWSGREADLQRCCRNDVMRRVCWYHVIQSKLGLRWSDTTRIIFFCDVMLGGGGAWKWYDNDRWEEVVLAVMWSDGMLVVVCCRLSLGHILRPATWLLQKKICNYLGAVCPGGMVAGHGLETQRCLDVSWRFGEFLWGVRSSREG